MTDNRMNKRPWTPRRIVRWIGTAAVVIALLMAIYGAHAVDSTVSPRFFFVYWTVFFTVLMIAISLATLDALATLLRFIAEHKKLLKRFGREIRGETDSDSQT